MRCTAAVWVLLALAAACPAGPFRYPEGRHGAGELRYRNGVPVLVVAGSPEQIGEQMGVLALRPAAPAIGLFDQLLKQQGLSHAKPLLARLGDGLLGKCPPEYRRELDAAARAGGIDRDLLVIGNTFHDVRRAFGCAALAVAPGHSSTGGALMGRNLDFPIPLGMHAYSLVIVYRPDGKKPFATVSFPGSMLTGCAMSAVNADGLVFGQNDAGPAADGSPAFDLSRTPTAALARRILEGCSTVDEAERLLQADKPAGRSIFVLCDRSGGGVIEATPKTVVLRRGEGGMCVATNNFRCKELTTSDDCRRGVSLSRAAGAAKLSVADVAAQMHAVHQGNWTAHALVFEPGPLKLHAAFGDGERPALDFPLREIDLSDLLKPPTGVRP